MPSSASLSPSKMMTPVRSMQPQKKRPSSSNLESCLKFFVCGFLFFYIGVSVGWNIDRPCECPTNNNNSINNAPINVRTGSSSSSNNNINNKNGGEAVTDVLEKTRREEELEEKKQWAEQQQDINNKLEEQKAKIERKLEKAIETAKDLKNKLGEEKEKTKKLSNKQQSTPKLHNGDIFRNRHTAGFARGMEFVDRDEFHRLHDSGIPLDRSGWGNDQVLILYSENSALPDENATTKELEGGGRALSAKDATKNCRNMHVVYTADSRPKQCIAIMAQYESFHVQKFMRMVNTETRSQRVTDMNLPLRYVNRNMQLSGEESISVPDRKISLSFWKYLSPYLDSLRDVLMELKPIAKSVASNNDHNTIIVMVCNLGHSELLMNFVCNAHAKGGETQEALKSILVFPTDLATHQLVQSLGLTSFYSESVFGGIPQEAAGSYGDQAYSKIMGSKVYCVHLVSQLGFDLLFQDVDVVWYKNPIPWFYKTEPDKNNFVAKEWDMVFQDDGARTLFFAPYSANTGFYFVRNNPKTQYFFNQLLFHGDLVLSIGSHQSVLIAMLSEFASLYGLRVKTWSRFTSEFPGGHAYHQRGGFMKRLVLSKNSTDNRGLVEKAYNTTNKDLNITERVDPYIFHMSWTESKDNKLKFFEQMGEWYLKDECNPNSASAAGKSQENPTVQSCCAAKPIIKCYYRDKPSIIPCPDAPAVDQKPKPKESFW